MLTAPYVDNYMIKDFVRREFGYYSGRVNKPFTEDQLDTIVEIISRLLNPLFQQFTINIDRAIIEATPTPDQIHKLFLDKLMENAKE